MPEPITREFTKGVRVTRQQLAKFLDPLRPELFRYCRSLTGDLWDAEDLVQDTLFRAFAKLADVHWQIDNPRAYVFRIATNLWIDIRRRPEEAQMPENFDAPAREQKTPEIADAIAELAHHLPAQERAALLLKDVFDFSLNDIAAQLRTSTGAVKAALHRGRKKLDAAKENRHGREDAGRKPQRAGAPSAALLQKWCEAFNARDLQGLANLMLEDAEADVVGVVQEYGRAQIRDGSLHHTIREENGDPEARVAEFRGEPVIVLWYTVEEGGTKQLVVRDVLRFIEAEGGVRTLRYYYFCPETLAEVARELKLPLKDNGYRY